MNLKTAILVIFLLGAVDSSFAQNTFATLNRNQTFQGTQTFNNLTVNGLCNGCTGSINWTNPSPIGTGTPNTGWFTRVKAGILNNIVYVDGVTYTTVQAAINALPANGGTVMIPCSATPYVGPTSITSGVNLKASCTQTSPISFGWAVAANSATFTYTSSLTISNAFGIALDGIVLDFGNSGGLTLDTVSGSQFRMAVVNCKNTAPCVTLTATNVSTEPSAINRVYYLATSGGAKGLALNGAIDSGGGPVTAWIIDWLEINTPSDASGNGTFIDFQGYADSNYIKYALLSGCPSGGASAVVHGVRFNSRNSGSYFGVYNNRIDKIDFNITTCATTGNGSDELNFGVSTDNAISLGSIGGSGMLDVNHNPIVAFNSACNSGGCPNTIQTMSSYAPKHGTADPQTKAMRFAGIGPTAATIGATATASYAWNFPFNDAGYTVVCNGVAPTGVPQLYQASRNTSTINFTIVALTAVAASFPEIDCIAVHDTVPQW